jgi:Tfp pilus assembly protein FimV
MKKISVYLSSLVLQSLTISAFAIGVNGIEVKSGLDQRLHAEVLLSDVSEDNDLFFAVSATSLNKKIGGIGYILQKSDSGSDILKISSQRPIDKAIVTLDIVATDKGKQVLAEEYTIMLDPIPHAAEVNFDQYGPVKKGETLDSITASVKPVYVGLAAASNAIHTANPHAFDKGDPKKLIAGSYLIIPDLAFHINRNEVTNKSKIADLDGQFQALSKQLNTQLDGVYDKHGQLSQHLVTLEGKMSVLLESIARIERNQNIMKSKLGKQISTSPSHKGVEPDLGKSVIHHEANGPFSWTVAILGILLLAFLWLGYYLMRRYKDSNVEDASPKSNAPVAVGNLPEVEESFNEEINEADFIPDEALFISEKMKSDDGMFLNSDLEEVTIEKDSDLAEEGDLKEDQEELQTEDLMPAPEIVEVGEAETETEIVGDEEVNTEVEPNEESDVSEVEEENSKEGKPGSGLKLTPLDKGGSEDDKK